MHCFATLSLFVLLTVTWGSAVHTEGRVAFPLQRYFFELSKMLRCTTILTVLCVEIIVSPVDWLLVLEESIQFSDTPYFVVKYSIFAKELGTNFVALTALLTWLPEGALLHNELCPTSLLLHFWLNKLCSYVMLFQSLLSPCPLVHCAST